LLSVSAAAPAQSSAAPEAPLRERYLDWASLLKRVFGDDLLTCPRCGHSGVRVIAAIDDPPIVEEILRHLNLPHERPPIAPACAPPALDDAWEFGDSDFGDFGDSDFGDSDFEVIETG
jgi:hypothetical protein